MSVDVRTRVDGARVPLAPGEVFGDVLPAAFDEAAALLAPAAAALAPPPLAIDVDGDQWTLRVDNGRVAVAPATGPTGGLRLRLGAQQLDDLVADQATPMAWFTSGTLDLDGRLERLLDWWLLVRGALDRVAPHVAAAPASRHDDAPPPPRRSFGVDDPDDELRAHLEAWGYLHVAGVFSEAEMAAVSADMDRLAPGYHPGDGRSWWATTADGTERLVRMQGFDQGSRAVAAFLADGRLDRFAALTGDGHVAAGSLWHGLEALVKPVGVVEGISDVPWHKDCSHGRHSYECCALTVGISVTGADAVTGQLKVVAGSHRVLVWPALLRADNDLAVVDLPTRTGDVTVHLSCTLHMAQPPVAGERRVLYTGLPLPRTESAAGDDALARLRAARESAPVTVSQPPGQVG